MRPPFPRLGAGYPFGGFLLGWPVMVALGVTHPLRSASMSALVARRIGVSLALAAGLSLPLFAQQASAASLTSSPIPCAPNADVSSSGCGNTGAGNSGFGNTGGGNSGAGNTGTGNSGTNNNGTANSGTGNNGTGNSGCNNTGVANSGNGNVGVALSGGTPCPASVTPTTPPPTTPPTTPRTTPTTVENEESTLPTAVPPTGGAVGTLPVTGRNSTTPITLAFGLLLTGVAAVGLANRRRHAFAAVNGGELMPLSAAMGLLLTGRAKAAEKR